MQRVTMAGQERLVPVSEVCDTSPLYSYILVTEICRQREFRQLSSHSSVTSSSGVIGWKLSALALVFAS
jgi:hypothetical protein